MRPATLLGAILACLGSVVSATALTYKLAPNEKACFFTFVQERGAKIAFYFAVRTSPCEDEVEGKLTRRVGRSNQAVHLTSTTRSPAPMKR